MTASRVIVALDYPSMEEAVDFVDKIAPAQCKLKVGAELFTVGGPPVIATFVERGFDVFLDLKFHDIPTTVAKACSAAADLGVWMLDVHTLGGRHMLDAACEAVSAANHRPLLVGVTLLTSHSKEVMGQVGLHGELAERVDALATLAHDVGLDGVVCSPWEAAGLRDHFGQG
ncbi:MAG: orotidine-5'-phosphate decarboxylase, partial [Acidiferrobacterales bacterium]